MITNQETGTRVDEVAAGIYRICAPLDVIPGGFTFNSNVGGHITSTISWSGLESPFAFGPESSSPCPGIRICT